MTSTFTWLDYSEYDRQKMHELIERLSERETRDELGIGSVRDAFADMFFPGTSTIQTRVRYFFFVPWIYQDIEARSSPLAKVDQAVREKESSLINALIKGGEKLGVIGSDAREKLKRFPSSIYWQGLERWGLRASPWSQDQYHRWLARHLPLPARVKKAEDDSIFAIKRMWLGSLPNAPTGFLERASFQLTQEESQYLRERILASARNSLLAELAVRRNPPPDVEFVWLADPDFAEPIQEQLEHARNFSETMQGAAFLYNLMLAEKSNNRDRIQEYRQHLIDWGKRISNRRAALANWDQRRFWQIVRSVNPRITFMTESFIATWLGWATNLNNAQIIVENQAARDLILARERQLKKAQARLENPRALELWNGAAGTSQLDYRWRIARRHLIDIIEGARTGHA